MSETQNLEAESLLTSAEVAKLLQVDATSIINWSKKGYLQYYRTPGGHRRIKAADVVSFLKQRGMPIPPTLTGIDEKRLMVVEKDQKAVAQIKKELEPYTAQLQQVYCESVVEALLEVGTFRPQLMLIDANVDNVKEVVAQVKKRGVDVMLINADGNKNLDDVGAIGVLSSPMSSGPVLNQLGLVERA